MLESLKSFYRQEFNKDVISQKDFAMKSQSLSIDLITVDAGTQMRAGTRQETIAEYAELLKGSTSWNFDTNAVVFYDGEKYYLADGFRRYHACLKAGRASMMCDVYEGSKRDAVKHALQANQNHGLRRTNADKRAAVEFVLGDAEWGNLSSRAIAELAGVSANFVNELRKETQAQVSSDDTSSESETEGAEVLQTRIGVDGRAYTFSPPKPSPPQKESPKPAKIAAEEEYEDLVDDEPVAKPKPGSEVLCAARIIDELIRSCYSPPAN